LSYAAPTQVIVEVSADESANAVLGDDVVVRALA
jgi:hypothetical protein